VLYAGAACRGVSRNQETYAKTRIGNPLLCDSDGPIYQLREWYRQFYLDIDGLPPESNEPTVFEFDAARGSWMRLKQVPPAAASELHRI